MKRWVKIVGRVLGGLAALLVLLVLVGYTLPRELQLETTQITVEASPAELFRYFDNRAGQQRLWSKAAEGFAPGGFPPMEIVDLGGAEAGVGVRLGFFPARASLGSFGGIVSTMARGRGIILESEPNARVVYEIDFGVVVVRRTIEFDALASGGSTRVSWSEALEASNPLMRWVLWGVDPAMGENFHGVLQALVEVVEEDQATIR